MAVHALVNHTLHSLVAPDTNASALSLPGPWTEPAFTVAAKFRVGVTCFFFIIASCSNVAVLVSISGKRCKSHLRVLILSLSVADLLVTFLVMPLDALWNITVQWYAGEIPCKVLSFGKLFAMYSAAFVLVVISLDRHWAILYPLSFTSAGQRNRIMLWTAWVGSLLLASPQLFLFRLRTVPGVNFTQCATHGSFPHRWQETTYNMFTFCTLFVTPLGVMIVCYTRILWEIGKQMKHKNELARSKNDLISKARLKTLKMTLVIVASFMICWTPYYLLGIWYWFKPEMIHQIPEYVHHSLFLFGLLHTCTDPLVYGLYTPSFKEDMRSWVRRMGSLMSRKAKNSKQLAGSEVNIKDFTSVDGPSSSGITLQSVF
ncbi:gonadotropin-releasing hormone II receptor-like [Spea bombifrons]|uniref:gonadotropin-releasing hormone II receptor-like n=1 Tax=Spea bombifrons TaxID=233779 RepID=UPI00234AE376|nr:gonadotropin-releasing hormone II receptor-like [Spea bombifrons]